VTNRRLTVHTATIHTATVEVKTLRLDAKQVTLAVFRQLQEQSILDRDRDPTRLLGQGWGWVHYCPGPGQCEWIDRGLPPGRHRHLVWQRDEELRRCVSPLPPFSVLTLASGVFSPALIDAVAALDDLPQLFIAV